VLQFVWIVVWLFALLGVLHSSSSSSDSSDNCGSSSSSSSGSYFDEGDIDATDTDCPMDFSYGLYFLMLISFFWGQQVIQNISHTTTSGTVAAWWFMHASSNKQATLGAFKRATTTSLGSICFGSLLVAIVRALRSMANQSRDRNSGGGGAALACVAECILGCLESIILWINKWAFVYVGIYGMDFKTSGGSVWELFKRRGWTAIINDNLVDSVLSLGIVVCGLVTGGAGLLVVKTSMVELSIDSITAGAIVGLAGLIFGMAMCSVVMSVIDSAVSTMFVCLAEDPGALQRTHPEVHHSLMQAWIKMHPSKMRECGYCT